MAQSSVEVVAWREVWGLWLPLMFCHPCGLQNSPVDPLYLAGRCMKRVSMKGLWEAFMARPGGEVHARWPHSTARTLVTWSHLTATGLGSIVEPWAKENEVTHRSCRALTFCATT